MIPYLLAVAGGYLIGKNASIKKFANGGVLYKDLSQEKPDVVLDNSGKGVAKIEEIDITLKKSTEIPERFSKAITSSRDAAELLYYLWNKEQMRVQEQFNVIYLNKSNTPIGYYQHSKGGLDGTVADIEIITSLAVKSLAKGVIVAHNHPSGNLNPSQSDLRLSKELKEALKLFNITLLDSLILVPEGVAYYSMIDEGII
jgi:DNA repair protein RadC